MHHIVLLLQFFRQWLEYVEFGQRRVRPVPAFGRILLIGNVEAIDVSIGKVASDFSNPDAKIIESASRFGSLGHGNGAWQHMPSASPNIGNA